MDKINELDKPYNFKAINETETDLCRLLWKCVALQAVVDARSKSQKPEMQEVKASAIDWLNGQGEYAIDFEMVCEFAGLEPQSTKRNFIELATHKREGIDFRCMKREAPANRGQERRSKYLKRIRYQKKLKVKAELELETAD